MDEISELKKKIADLQRQLSKAMLDEKASRKPPKPIPVKKWVPEPNCRKCGLPLSFVTLENGKLKPVNQDGSDHWDLCAMTIRGGRPFDSTDPRDQQTSGFITGKHYFDSGCECVPWEKCSCGSIVRLVVKTENSRIEA